MKPTSPPPMKKKTLKKTETSSEAHLIHQKVKQHWNENASDWVLASRKGYDVWRDHLNTPAFLTGLWTNRDLIRARDRGRARARPNPVNLFFEPI